MKRFHRFQWSLLAALCLATAVRADIVTLKSGEKLEGRILKDNPDSIEMEYHLTPKIKDNKTLLKSDIADIKRQTAAEVEFEERGIKGILPTQDLLTASEYESIIQDKLRTFAAKYPGTPETAQVEKIIATLAEEKSKVVSGQMKMEGKWLDSATVKREQYNIEAYHQRMLIKSKEAESNDMHYLNAVREFEKLRNDFGASPYFAIEIPDALELLKKYETQLTSMITAAPLLLKKRDEGLRSTANAVEKEEARKKIDEETKAFQAKFDAQTKEKVKWKDIYPYHLKSLQEALATVTKERVQLQSLDLSALQKENESLMSIIAFLADNKPTEARLVYDPLSKDPNLVNKKMLPGLLKQIEAQQKDKTDAAKKDRKVVVTESAPNATAPTSSNTNPMAETLAKVQAEKLKKQADKNKTGGTASDNKSDDGKDPAKKPTPTVAAATPADEGGGIGDYIPMIGGGLLVVILVAWFLGKRKKDKE